MKLRYLSNAITKAKQRLKRIAAEDGIYENFGQKEVDKIKDKYIDISKYTDEMNETRKKIEHFREWCSTYNGEE
jgi:hypothetical protein